MEWTRVRTWTSLRYSNRTNSKTDFLFRPVVVVVVFACLPIIK